MRRDRDTGLSIVDIGLIRSCQLAIAVYRAESWSEHHNESFSPRPLISRVQYRPALSCLVLLLSPSTYKHCVGPHGDVWRLDCSQHSTIGHLCELNLRYVITLHGAQG
jgi:hypothetical protein